MKLAVLNPWGRDPEQHFPDFAGSPEKQVHAPVNHHAYAACTGGSFFNDPNRIPAEQKQVLLLVRKDSRKTLTALKVLKKEGKTVVITWKEAGLHQLAGQLNGSGQIRDFREICALADGAISSVQQSLPLYESMGAKKSAFIPTPYPVEDSRWDFSVPLEQRAGIFIGTREWDVPSRNHLLALSVALASGKAVTVMNADGRVGLKILNAFNAKNLRVVEGPIPYVQYLRDLSRHRVVWQMDASGVPGQVAGDALLCKIPCVGGNSAIEQLAFPNLSNFDSVISLLQDDNLYRKEVELAQQRAKEMISFKHGAEQLAEFFQRL